MSLKSCLTEVNKIRGPVSEAFADGLTLDDAVRHINGLEVRLRENLPEIGWILMEPDVED